MCLRPRVRVEGIRILKGNLLAQSVLRGGAVVTADEGNRL